MLRQFTTTRKETLIRMTKCENWFRCALARSCVLSTALLLLLLLSIASGRFGVAEAAASGEPSIPSEIAEYQKDHGLSSEAAQHALTLQDRAAPIVEEMKRVQGAEYAGIWFDPSAGEFVVPRAVMAGVNRGVEGALKGMGLKESEFRTPLVASSWTELEEAQKEVGARAADLGLSGSTLTFLDPRRNAVVVWVAEGAARSDKESLREFSKSSSVKTEIEVQPGDRLGAENLYCRPESGFRACSRPMRAGVAIGPDLSGTHGPTCTAAFKAIGKAFGNRFMLTAGHCVHFNNHWDSYEATSGEPKEIGWVEEKNEAPGDWAKIKANGSYWDTASWPSLLSRWGIDEEVPVEGESASYTGEWVCRSGMFTDRCDEVVAENVTASNLGREHLAMIGGTCAEPGDSGGPVYDGRVAIGITSAKVLPAPPCDEQYVLFSEVTEATDAMGVEVGPRLGAPPFAETGEACCAAFHHAVLSGEVAPHGITSNYYFEYGTTEAYGQVSGIAAAGSEWGKKPVNAEIAGLKGKTTYQYRIRAQNAAGISYGYDYEFTTPDWRPAISYQATTGRTATAATLNAKVNPQGEATTYHFEWGETASYGNSAPVPDASIGSGTSDIAVSRALSSLKPETTYHFRVVAKNGEGTQTGPDATFTTLANTPAYASSFGATGTGNGQFSRPTAMAADAPGGVPSGEVWVVDKQNNRVEKFNAKGEYVTKFGATGAGAGQFNEPRAIAVDAEGNLWVADGGNDRIEKFNSKGEYLTEIDDEGFSEYQSINIPSGIAVGKEGHIFIANQGSGGSVVELLTTATGLGGTHLAGFWFATTTPANMATDPQGDVWIVDQSENKLYEIPYGSSELLARFGATGSGSGQLSAPYAVAVKPSGTLLVSDRGNNRIEQFSQSGELLATFGKAGNEAGQFCEPSGIALSSRGVIFVADACHDKIQRWNQQTSPEAVTQPASSVTASGATLNARINPSGLATTYRFEYGTTNAYGSSVPASPGSLAAGFADSTVAVPLTGLVPDTTYHRRIVATNSEGTTYGKDRTFVTTSGTATFASSFGTLGSGNGQLNRPLAVAADAPGGVPSGNVWVVDSKNNRVEKFNSKGEYLSQFGSFGTGNGQFNEPRGIVVDSQGDLWVTDAGNRRIEKFNSNGEYLTKIVSEYLAGLRDLIIPTGIAIGREGHLFVTDQGNEGQIDELRTSPSGGFYTVWTYSATTNPAQMAADAEGDVWAVDSAENKVYEIPHTGFGSEGAPVARFGATGAGAGQLTNPYGIAVKPNGNLLISDRGNNRIEQFSPSGTFQLQFGSAGSGAGQFSEPGGIAIGPDGSAYVADSNNNRISKWTFK